MGRLKTNEERQRKKEIRKDQKKLAKAQQRQIWAAESAAKAKRVKPEEE